MHLKTSNAHLVLCFTIHVHCVGTMTLFLYVKGYLSLKLFRVFLAALGVLYVIVRVRLILTKSAKESDGDKDI